MFNFKHFFVVVMMVLVGFIGMAAQSDDVSAAQTIRFTSAMHTNKNLTYKGTIKYYVKGDAKKYQADINYAANRWNKALGRKVLRPTNSQSGSRLVFTGTNKLGAGYAGMAEINSGVIALNNSWMNRYSNQKQRAVVIHELGHTFGTKDLYNYPDASLRSTFKKQTIMGGNYSTNIKSFDAKLAKWTLSKTRSMSATEFNHYRSNKGLYYQQMLHGQL
ncbi:snapalysin family zinc-dependent metalloprotease [Lentilactobacillus sp. IMAU92037]|uniref:snapalysin family zinc-dependent metalloprotease n=1 Tax=Lentilactobacillus TaxID=2767893 RepID=UPI001C25CF2C|nr:MULTISPECIES: snapalysin family zinc-dependent metalloprotease [Lentilactobacillus]MBU9789787.1 snapalysin family zinc-dependent metalloprotease [Lentilactobacillus dabitei]MBV0931594.1 snapalysin family zinc-dependent metalloprotease [Lentilactobacillus dabitei]MDM7517579.1 snapalysin family zinc-dependent metalloprotease [Lentilactobacillus sp. TOM.63]